MQNPLFKISGLTQKQFQTLFKGQPKAADSLKAFSSTAAPLDGTLCSINIWLSSMSNPNFFILVRYRKIEQVACALTILQKVHNKFFKIVELKCDTDTGISEIQPNLQNVTQESRTDIPVFQYLGRTLRHSGD